MASYIPLLGTSFLARGVKGRHRKDDGSKNIKLSKSFHSPRDKLGPGKYSHSERY